MTMPPRPSPAFQPAGQSRELHARWIAWIDAAEAMVVPLVAEYPPGHISPFHHHSRAQMFYAISGTIAVATEQGRWMVPPDHALWVPAGIEHSVAAQGGASVRSIYVKPDSVALPQSCRVVAMTPLMRALVIEAAALAYLHDTPSHRSDLIMALIMDEIPRLEEKPLGLPLPADPRLAALCHTFLTAPSSHATIDDWAEQLAMSRRAFTRAFRRETGLGLSMWRQQACLFAAMPRLARGEAITTVAMDLGYDSVAAFTTMFKRMLGAAPSRYFHAPPFPLPQTQDQTRNQV